MKVMGSSSFSIVIAFATAALLLTGACSSDSSDDELTEDVAETGEKDTESTGSEDIFIPEPCPGFAPPGKPEAEHDHECKDIIKCTTMPEPESGGCYCAYCGWKGIDMKCIQVLCPPAN